MLKYEIKLNGVELTDVAIGVSAIEKFEEPKDDAGINLPFTTQNYEYEMRGLLTIKVDDGTNNKTFAFLIISDVVSEGSKYGEWKHDLTVLEYSHKFDVYLRQSMIKTKSLKNDILAPYDLITCLNSSDPISGERYNVEIIHWLDPLNIITTYYAGEPVTFSQVEQAYQVILQTGISFGTFERRPSFIKAGKFTKDIDGNVILGVETHAESFVSEGDITWTFEKGRHYVDYGFNATTGVGTTAGLVTQFRFYINVIERENFSVLDLVNSVRQNISKFGGIESKLHYDATRIFDIDENIEEFLASVEAPQTFIQKATAWEVLNSIFKYINAISRLEYREGLLDLLTITEFNKISGNFEIGDISGYGSRQDAKHLANKGINWLERVLPNNLEEATIKSPSENLFKTVRSKDIQIKQDNFELKLERIMYQPKKFDYNLFKFTIEPVTGGITTYNNFPLDLTSRLLNRDEWDLKLITVDYPTIILLKAYQQNIGLQENKVANLYWQQGGTSIKLADPYGDVVQVNLIANVIREAFNEYITRNFPKPIEINATEICTSYDVDKEITDGGFVPADDFRKLKFNLEYITQENLTIETNREDISYSKYYTEARINQNEKLLNIALASRKSYGDLQRAGVPDITFSIYHENIADILDLALQDSDGFVIVQRKLEFHNEYIYATYSATKDHNRLSEFIGLEQAYRWAEIPTSKQIFERIENYSDYIIITKPTDSVTETVTKIYSTNVFRLIFGSLVNDWYDIGTQGKTKITLAYVRTDGFLEVYPDDSPSGFRHAILTPVASFGVKGGFVFGFGFENNQVAGDGVTTSIVGGATLYWNKAIRYTDLQGKFTELWFELTNKYYTLSTLWTEDEKNNNYPLVRDTTPPNLGFSDISFRYYICGVPNVTASTYDPLIIDKDSGQNIKISYQNSIISKDYLHYIFGQLFYSENFIVKNPKVEYNVVVGTPMYLYLYKDNTKGNYGKFDDLKIKSGYEVPITLLDYDVNVEIDLTERTFRFIGGIDLSAVTSWAIGDINLNLYMACNGNENGFNFYKTHFRPNLVEIGK